MGGTTPGFIRALAADVTLCMFTGNTLITGASGGIGSGVARRLAARGTRLFLTGRDAGRLEAVRSECGPEAVAAAADLTASGEAARVVGAAWEALGGFEVVIHCAGVGLLKPSAQTSDADFVRVMNTNARATFLVAQQACTLMAERKQGLFLTLPGVLGKAPMRGAAAYAASKYAVTGMLKCMGLEYGRLGVRFSLLFLGGVDTPFWEGIGTGIDRSKLLAPGTVADLILAALDAPLPAVVAEIVAQPESHQLL